jgi:hypothetical protein
MGSKGWNNFSTNTHEPKVEEFITNEFHVDDDLKSCPTEEDAIELIHKIQDAMKVRQNLRLHTFALNGKTVMNVFDS